MQSQTLANLWRTTPLYRDEVHGSWPENAPPPLGDAVDREDVQWLGDGAGPTSTGITAFA
jgi:hypothetical protein